MKRFLRRNRRKKKRMAREFVKRVTKVAILPKGEPIFTEKATYIEIVDEAGGEFVEVEQSNETATGKIRLDDDEWFYVREAINEMFKEIKKHGNKS